MGSVRMGPPLELITALRQQFDLRSFVETGTYLAETAVWAASQFEQVYTIEHSEPLFQKASQTYKDVETIRFLYGDTRDHLMSILSQHETPCLIWLDAHWSGGYTYGHQDECPLLEELAIIADQTCDHFILIDDARLFLSPPPPPHDPEQWPALAEVMTALHRINPQFYTVVTEDVIVAVPLYARETVLTYCRQSRNSPPAPETSSIASVAPKRSRRSPLLPGETGVIKGLIRDHHVVFDVGANWGDWSISVLENHPNVNLHLFEPLPGPYQDLLARLSSYFPQKTVTPNRLAVSSRSETCPFYYYGNDRSTLSTFYRRVQAEQQFQIPAPNPMFVQTTTLDEYCRDMGISRIHFLKIDVEGAEKDVLKGAQSLLRGGRVDYVQFEYGGTYLDAGISLEETYTYLANYRYHLFKILPNGLEYLPSFSSQYETYDYSNYLAVNERLVDLILNTTKSMLNLPQLVIEHGIDPRGVIHIGAHEGKELGNYQDMGVEQIIFIEANPAVYGRLQAKVSGVPGVRVINCAISDQDGTATLHITSMDQSSSLLPLKKHKQIYPGVEEIQQITVTARTLDSLLQEHQIDPTNYTMLNIDIQGAELLALRGAVNCLSSIQAINVEVNYEELYEGCPLVEDLDVFLFDHGFRRVATKCPYHSSWGDAFYVKVPEVTMSLLGQYGRFGNQLFQYLFLRLYAQRYDLRYAVPPWVGQRFFQIDDPHITHAYPRVCDWGNVSIDGILEAYGRPLQSIDIFGYFQYHTRYYREHRDYIRKLFAPTDSIKSALGAAIATKLRSRGKTLVGLHLRRGDFGYKYFFVAPSEWYLEWLDGLWETLDEPVLYIASDEIDLVKDDFEKYSPVTAQDLDIDLPELRKWEFFTDFYILSQCDLLAISNSSFSFFASMLNQNGWSFFRPELLTQKLVPYSPWDAEPLFRHGTLVPGEDGEIHFQKDENYGLRRIRLIALPDWQAPTEILYEQLTQLIEKLLQIPKPKRVRLVLPVFDLPIEEEHPDPEAIVNDVILTMMLEDNSLQETKDLPTISFVEDGINPIQWDVLLAAVQYRMPLEYEATAPLSLREKLSLLPPWPGIEVVDLL